jgi:glycosyltransferase involved in cell wall biosynthesis
VLVASYNYAKYIEEALESMLRQTYPNFEVIVCDDGSTDNSRQVIEQYANRDSRIKFFFKENGGVASALNAAYLQSNGQIICLLDADDYFAPEKVQKVTCELIAHPESGMVLHPVMRVDTKGHYQGRYPLRQPVPRGWLAPYAVSIGGSIPWMPPAGGISIRRELTDCIFPINEKLRSHIDVIIRLLGAMLSPVTGIDEVLTYYRLHGSNISNLPAKLTIASHLERRRKGIKIAREIYDYEASWLRKYFPNVQLLPFERTWGYIESQYMIAKLAREPRSVQSVWYRQLISHSQAQAQVLYPLYQLSWWLPPEVFNKIWDIVSGHNKLKAMLSIFRVRT